MEEFILTPEDFSSTIDNKGCFLHAPNTLEVFVTGGDITKVSHISIKGIAIANGIKDEAIVGIYRYLDPLKFYVTLDCPDVAMVMAAFQGKVIRVDSLGVTTHWADVRKAIVSGSLKFLITTMKESTLLSILSTFAVDGTVTLGPKRKNELDTRTFRLQLKEGVELPHYLPLRIGEILHKIRVALPGRAFACSNCYLQGHPYYLCPKRRKPVVPSNGTPSSEGKGPSNDEASWATVASRKSTKAQRPKSPSATVGPVGQASPSKEKKLAAIALLNNSSSSATTATPSQQAPSAQHETPPTQHKTPPRSPRSNTGSPSLRVISTDGESSPGSRPPTPTALNQPLNFREAVKSPGKTQRKGGKLPSTNVSALPSPIRSSGKTGALQPLSMSIWDIPTKRCRSSGEGSSEEGVQPSQKPKLQK